MTKFILVLHICSFIDLTCNYSMHKSQHDTWFECAKEGYKQSYVAIHDYEEIEINERKLAVRFECKPIQIKES